MIEKNGLAAWKKQRARDEREEFARVRMLRAELFESVDYTCLCCGMRPVESIHEEPPRSVGTVPSRTTSIPCCGSGTTGCHGLMQSKRIIAQALRSDQYLVGLQRFGARHRMIQFADGERAYWSFTATHPRARAHLQGEEVAN